MLKKSNKISLEEATRLAILGKLPLKESKEVSKKVESTTVSTSNDGITSVETDDANIIIEPKDNAAVDVGTDLPVCVDETPVEEVPVEEPVEVIDEPAVDETPVDEQDEMFEGKEIKVEDKEIITESEDPKKGDPRKKIISKTGIKKVEKKEADIEKKLKVKMTERKLEESSSIQVVAEYTAEDLDDELWSGALDRWKDMSDEAKEYLIDYFNEGIGASTDIDDMPTLTTFNDFVWFDSDDILAEAGLAESDEDLEESKKTENILADGMKDALADNIEMGSMVMNALPNAVTGGLTEGKAEDPKKGDARKKVISKTGIKKVEASDVKKGDPRKKIISKHDIKKIESKCEDCGKEQKIVEKEEPKKHIINKVDLKKEEARQQAIAKIIKEKKEAKRANLNDTLKTKVAEGLSKFVKEAYVNGKEVVVEKVLKLTENKLFVKGQLVMENSAKDFSCKLVPVKENKSFIKYTINENKLLKITEGKTSKGKEFNLIVRK